MGTPPKLISDDIVLPVYQRLVKAAEEEGVVWHYLGGEESMNPAGLRFVQDERMVYLNSDLETPKQQMLVAVVEVVVPARARVIRERAQRRFQPGDEKPIGTQILDDEKRDKGIARLRMALRELRGAKALFEEAAGVREEASRPLAHRMDPWPERRLATLSAEQADALEKVLDENDAFQGQAEVRSHSDWDELLSAVASGLAGVGFSSGQIASWILGDNGVDATKAIEAKIRRFRQKTGDLRSGQPEA